MLLDCCGALPSVALESAEAAGSLGAVAVVGEERLVRDLDGEQLASEADAAFGDPDVLPVTRSRRWARCR